MILPMIIGHREDFSVLYRRGSTQGFDVVRNRTLYRFDKIGISSIFEITLLLPIHSLVFLLKNNRNYQGRDR